PHAVGRRCHAIVAGHLFANLDRFFVECRRSLQFSPSAPASSLQQHRRKGLPMKATLKAVLATSLLLAPAAFATKVPIPIEGATLNISVQVQTQALINENGAPSGKDPSYDIYVRRTRLHANGDINQNFSYLIQVDNA